MGGGYDAAKVETAGCVGKCGSSGGDGERRLMGCVTALAPACNMAIEWDSLLLMFYVYVQRWDILAETPRYAPHAAIVRRRTRSCISSIRTMFV